MVVLWVTFVVLQKVLWIDDSYSNSLYFFKISLSGPMGEDGVECPSFCPVNCGMDEMVCNGGDDANGCMQPEYCIPSKGIHSYF